MLPQTARAVSSRESTHVADESHRLTFLKRVQHDTSALHIRIRTRTTVTHQTKQISLSAQFTSYLFQLCSFSDGRNRYGTRFHQGKDGCDLRSSSSNRVRSSTTASGSIKVLCATPAGRSPQAKTRLRHIVQRQPKGVTPDNTTGYQR